MREGNHLFELLLIIIVSFVIGAVCAMSFYSGNEYDAGYYTGQLDASHGKWMSIKRFKEFQGEVPEWIKEGVIDADNRDNN